MVKELIVTKQGNQPIVGQFYDCKDFDTIIDYDCDIYYYKDNVKTLLCKFRKNVLNQQDINIAYDTFIKPVKSASSMRGASLGVARNKRHKVKSLIVGYWDKQQVRKSFQTDNNCRLTKFNKEHINEFNHTLPLFQSINSCISSGVISESCLNASAPTKPALLRNSSIASI